MVVTGLICITVIFVVAIIAGAISWNDEQTRKSNERIRLAQIEKGRY
jgi:hypothetical protein